MEEVNDEDVAALDRMMVAEVVSLLMNVWDRHDVALTFHLDPCQDVEASFCTCVDATVENYQDDVD